MSSNPSREKLPLLEQHCLHKTNVDLMHALNKKKDHKKIYKVEIVTFIIFKSMYNFRLISGVIFCALATEEFLLISYKF